MFTLYTLGTKNGDGLYCDRDGLTYGGLPLVARAANGRFAPVEQQGILKSAFAPKGGGIQAVANALNEGQLARALIAAVNLGLPPITREDMAKLRKWDFDPDQPRDALGRWTAGDAAAAPQGPQEDESADTQPMDGVMDVSDTYDNTESADDLTFNADAAAQQLMDHVDGNLKPSEQCATFVREAIAVGGININPHPLDAEDYGPYLLNRGFEVVSPDSYEPQTGDIAVIQNYPGGNPSGHITMFTGSQWLSDYVQRDMWGGHGYRINQPSYKIYRSKNIK